MTSYTVTTGEDRKTGIWYASVRDDDGEQVARLPLDIAIDDRTDPDPVVNAAVMVLGLLEPDWIEHDKEFVYFGYGKPGPE